MANERQIAIGGSIPPVPINHVVQFYDTREALLHSVGGFFAEGLEKKEPFIIIARADSRRVFLETMLARVVSSRACLLIDAEEMMDRVMPAGHLDEALLRRHVTSLILAAAGSENVPVRIYGEVADILVSRGETETAFLLEDFWHGLAARKPYLILCSHSLDNFYDDPGGHMLDGVCRRHGRANYGD